MYSNFDFSSGPCHQHAADERIRLEELRQKVGIFSVFKYLVCMCVCLMFSDN